MKRPRTSQQLSQARLTRGHTIKLCRKWSCLLKVPPHRPQKGSGKDGACLWSWPSAPEGEGAAAAAGLLRDYGDCVCLPHRTVRIQMQTLVLVDFQVACWTNNQPNVRCYFSYAAAYIPGPGGRPPCLAPCRPSPFLPPQGGN